MVAAAIFLNWTFLRSIGIGQPNIIMHCIGMKNMVVGITRVMKPLMK